MERSSSVIDESLSSKTAEQVSGLL